MITLERKVEKRGESSQIRKKEKQRESTRERLNAVVCGPFVLPAMQKGSDCTSLCNPSMSPTKLPSNEKEMNLKLLGAICWSTVVA